MKEKITKLIDVKSMMTLAMTCGFILLTCTEQISSQEFLSLFTVVVGFYFGTQSKKSG